MEASRAQCVSACVILDNIVCSAEALESKQDSKRKTKCPASCHAPQPHKCLGDPAVDRSWLKMPPGIADRERARLAGVVVEPVWIGASALISTTIRPTGRIPCHYCAPGSWILRTTCPPPSFGLQRHSNSMPSITGMNFVYLASYIDEMLF